MSDNSFTRKEETCPLTNTFCGEEHKDCRICIDGKERIWCDEMRRRNNKNSFKPVLVTSLGAKIVNAEGETVIEGQLPN